MTGILRAADRGPEPWKNGAGVTTVVAEAPGGAPAAWRVSIATIEQPAEFSLYPGFTRLLMPLGEADLQLEVDGDMIALDRHTVLRFEGEQHVRARGVEAPQGDLNVFVERERADATLTAAEVRGSLTVSGALGDEVAERVVVVVVVLSGELTLEGTLLAAGDAVLVETGAVDLTGSGVVALAGIRTLSPGE